MRILFIIILLIVSLNLSGGTIAHQTIEVEGYSREYILYLPEDLPENAPLVLMIHGYSDNAENFMTTTRMNQLADKNKFAVCYPQGTEDMQGNPFWQVGYSFTKDIKINDLNFIASLIDSLTKEYAINRSNVFVVGHSNGADMCNYLALKAPHLVRAIAPVAGCIMEEVFEETRIESPLSVLMINSTTDNITYFTGCTNNSYYGAWLPSLTTFNYYVQRAQCDMYSVECKQAIKGRALIAEKYENSKDHTKVWLFQIIGGNHNWDNYVVDTSELIWDFFSKLSCK